MHTLFHRLSALSIASAIAVAAIGLLQPPAWAAPVSTLKTLHSFCAWNLCGDGQNLKGALFMDPSGDLYGTAAQSGKYGGGTVFELVPNADKSKYNTNVLHNFCKNNPCPDGAYPVSGLIMDVEGNLYGTTEQGGLQIGQSTFGTVFKLTHGGTGWVLSVLRKFCAHDDQFCSRGATPVTGLSYAGQDSGQPWDESSPLFGATFYGGANDKGVVYELTHSGSTWAYTVIHDFQSSFGPEDVTLDSAGNIYGTASYGGKYGGGILYKLANGTWKQTILHNFCTGSSCTGDEPHGRVARDSSGNLFGTTEFGGTGTECMEGSAHGCGVVFERSAGGTYKVLHNFCSQANCTDGGIPVAGVIVDRLGDLFGTTAEGGTVDGVVFELSSAGDYSVLHAFCSKEGCSDGVKPVAGVIMDSSGSLFGTTEFGGTHDGGTVFRITH
jgi:uncharacterized repeat protein (TIGR03803 family)